MDEFDSFIAAAAASEGGTKFRGYKPKHIDPLTRDKANFVDAIAEQVELLKAGGGKVNQSGNRSGNMFEVLPSGKVRVTIKNGITTMSITPIEFYDRVSATEACEFLEMIARASAAGKFDEEFKRTARKPSAKTKAKLAKLAQANVIDGVKSNGAAVAA